jgi:predicted metal-dependent HD superfamily phosphohydrolase
MPTAPYDLRMTDVHLRNLIDDMPPLLGALLVERFAASPLAYHNINHIKHMLEELDACFAAGLTARDARILRYAIWLHDLFYDVKAPDNERRSADIGLALLQWPEDEMRDLELCVMATKGHATDHPLARILVDLDLSILAAAREGYRRYALAVRDEYRLYPDEAYRQGRIRVLDHLCEAPLLRLVSLAKGLAEDELGQRACANMRWEQERLRDSDGTIEAALAGD